MHIYKSKKSIINYRSYGIVPYDIYMYTFLQVQVSLNLKVTLETAYGRHTADPLGKESPESGTGTSKKHGHQTSSDMYLA